MSRRPAIFTQADIARAIRAAKQPSVVYFVAIGKHVKIGVSTNLPKRLKSFMNSTVTVELLLSIAGDHELERRLHGLLSEARVAREIFHRDWRVQGFIDNAKFGGIERGLQWLTETTPERRKQKKLADREVRTRAARQSKAELDAYYAGLVADRKKRLGW